MNKKFKNLVFSLAFLVPLACTVPAKAKQLEVAVPDNAAQLPLTWWDSTSKFDRSVTTARKGELIQKILEAKEKYNNSDRDLSVADLYLDRDKYQVLDVRELPKVKARFETLGSFMEQVALTELNIMGNSIRDLMNGVYEELNDICSQRSKWSLKDLEVKVTNLNQTLETVGQTYNEFNRIKDELNDGKLSNLTVLTSNYFRRNNMALNDSLFTAFTDE